MGRLALTVTLAAYQARHAAAVLNGPDCSAVTQTATVPSNAVSLGAYSSMQAPVLGMR